MRPGLIRPGNASSSWAQPSPDALASMRPGLIRPGNDHDQVALGDLLRASMRPGLIRPGNPDGNNRERFLRASSTLQ